MRFYEVISGKAQLDGSTQWVLPAFFHGVGMEGRANSALAAGYKKAEAEQHG